MDKNYNIELTQLLSQYQRDPNLFNDEQKKRLLIESQNFQQNEIKQSTLDLHKQILEEYDIHYYCYKQGNTDIKKSAEKQLLEILQNSETVSILLIAKCSLQNKMLYDDETQTWFVYENDNKFVWSEASNNIIQQIILKEIANIFPPKLKNKKFKKLSQINDIIDYLAIYLKKNIQYIKNNHITVYKNTPIDFSDYQPIIKNNCKPTDFIFSYNPIPWMEGAKCPQIKEWLQKRFKNNPDTLNLFRAVSAIILRSNAHPFNLQIFLEIHGVPKSGKSLCGRLLQAIVGPSGFCASNLEKISINFELDKLVGKNLCIMPDQQAFSGNIETFKGLTGCDTVTARPIYGRPFDFRFYGLIVIISNYPFAMGAAAEAAINRRKLSIEFSDPINEPINTQLLDFDKITNEPIGLWKHELPGFIQWVFELEPDQVIAIINEATMSNERTPGAFSNDAYIKNKLMPCEGALIGFQTNKYGPPLFDELTNYHKQIGRKMQSSINLLTTLQQDYALQWPGYTIDIEETNEGPILKNVMYQNILPLDNWKLFQAMFMYYYDKNFFGKKISIKYSELTFLTQKPILRDNINDIPKITQDNNYKSSRYNLYCHLSSLTQETEKEKILEKLMEKIGTPMTLTEGEIQYNTALMVYFKEKHYHSFLNENINHTQFRILSVKDQQNLLCNFLYEWCEESPESTIPTKEYINLFKYYLQKQNYLLDIKENSFKQQIKEAYTILYPTKNIKDILKDAKNIGYAKLNGLQGLKFKSDI